MRRKRKTKVLTEAEKRAKKEAQAKRRQELAFKKKIKSIFIDSPKPSHSGQAPNGELNENILGASSSILMPHFSQA